MLYNGNLYWRNNFILCFIVYFIIIQFLTGNSVVGFLHLSICDGSNFLSIMSSPIYTQIVLIILLCMVHRNSLSKYTNINIIIICIYAISLTYYVVDLQSHTLVNSIFSIISFNNNLQNGLLNVHPILIYITYIYSIRLWHAMYNSNTLKFNLLFYTQTMIQIGVIILVGVILGAIWASQELNWGGFWSWDPVELISLFLFFFCIKILHNKKRVFILTPVSMFISAALLVYFIIRLGVVTTIHSFIRTSNIQFYVYVICVYIIVMRLIDKNIWIQLMCYYAHFPKAIRMHQLLVVYLFGLLLWLLIIHLIKLVFISLNIFDDMLLSLPKIYTILVVYILYLNLNIQVIKLFSFRYILILYFIYIYLPVYNLMLVIVFIIIYNGIKRFKNLHTIMLWSYIIFVIFFINLKSWYSQIDVHTSHLAVNSFTASHSVLQKYEEGFFLLKKNIILILKSTLQQVSGFSIYSNIYQTSYCFAKNNTNHVLFVHEFIFFVISLLYITVFNYLIVSKYTYKYCYY